VNNEATERGFFDHSGSIFTTLSSSTYVNNTEIINNSFTRVLNIEKKNQNIRDDLLIANNSAPSFSRQLEHEEEMKKVEGEPEPSVTVIRRGRGRGRKPTIVTVED
jgi:hypothetical protein